jgi:hypothetical protein
MLLEPESVLKYVKIKYLPSNVLKLKETLSNGKKTISIIIFMMELQKYANLLVHSTLFYFVLNNEKIF